MKMKRVFGSGNLSLDLNIRLLRCYVLSVRFYGVEAWILKKLDMKRLEEFELWIYRRIIKI